MKRSKNLMLSLAVLAGALVGCGNTNGSGTTGIACQFLKRNYIGIDKEKEYLDLTVKRFQKTKEDSLNEKKL